jgi:hypothetical protein
MKKSIKFEQAIEQVTEFIIGKKTFESVLDDVQEWAPKWAPASEFGTPKRKYKRKKK